MVLGTFLSRWWLNMVMWCWCNEDHIDISSAFTDPHMKIAAQRSILTKQLRVILLSKVGIGRRL